MNNIKLFVLIKRTYEDNEVHVLGSYGTRELAEEAMKKDFNKTLPDITVDREINSTDAYIGDLFSWNVEETEMAIDTMPYVSREAVYRHQDFLFKMEDVESQVKQHPEADLISEDDIEDIADNVINQLSKCDPYFDAYWDVVGFCIGDFIRNKKSK